MLINWPRAGTPDSRERANNKTRATAVLGIRPITAKLYSRSRGVFVGWEEVVGASAHTLPCARGLPLPCGKLLRGAYRPDRDLIKHPLSPPSTSGFGRLDGWYRHHA